MTPCVRCPIHPCACRPSAGCCSPDSGRSRPWPRWRRRAVVCITNNCVHVGCKNSVSEQEMCLGGEGRVRHQRTRRNESVMKAPRNQGPEEVEDSSMRRERCRMSLQSGSGFRARVAGGTKGRQTGHGMGRQATIVGLVNECGYVHSAPVWTFHSRKGKFARASKRWLKLVKQVCLGPVCWLLGAELSAGLYVGTSVAQKAAGPALGRPDQRATAGGCCGGVVGQCTVGHRRRCCLHMAATAAAPPASVQRRLWKVDQLDVGDLGQRRQLLRAGNGEAGLEGFSDLRGHGRRALEGRILTHAECKPRFWHNALCTRYPPLCTAAPHHPTPLYH